MIQIVFGPLSVILIVEWNKAESPRLLGFTTLQNSNRVKRTVLDKNIVELLVLNAFF